MYSVLLKVVSYYDLGVLCMSVGFQKKVGGWGELYVVLLAIFGTL